MLIVWSKRVLLQTAHKFFEHSSHEFFFKILLKHIRKRIFLGRLLLSLKILLWVIISLFIHIWRLVVSIWVRTSSLVIVYCCNLILLVISWIFKVTIIVLGSSIHWFLFGQSHSFGWLVIVFFKTFRFLILAGILSAAFPLRFLWFHSWLIRRIILTRIVGSTFETNY